MKSVSSQTKNGINKRTIQSLAERIGKALPVEKIILFGSHAWGRPGPDSDVDLFIIKETENTRVSARKASRLIFPRPFPIDLIVYTPGQTEKRKKMGDFFIRDVLNKGKTLYAK